MGEPRNERLMMTEDYDSCTYHPERAPVAWRDTLDGSTIAVCAECAALLPPMGDLKEVDRG